MSVYGSISNAGKTQLQFDKIYPNRTTLENCGSGDGVFVGRCVLIEYDDNTYSRRVGYIRTKDAPKKNEDMVLYSDKTCLVPFKPVDDTSVGYGLHPGDIVVVEYLPKNYAYFTYTGRTNSSGNALFQVVCLSGEILGREVSEDKEVDDYTINYITDKWLMESEGKRSGWDSTVWRKVVRDGQERYEMIASLNSVTPEFSIVPEAPSEVPVFPHLGENSTNIHYQMHLQPTWGFRVKAAEKNELSDTTLEYKITEFNSQTGKDTLVSKTYPAAIFYNKDGFNKETVVHSEAENVIKVEPTGFSGKTYLNHGSQTESYTERPDIQELSISLPALGNTISALWDIVYGGKDITGTNNRNLDISWDSPNGIRLVTSDPEGQTFVYTPKHLETIAGSINATHDLMGMIISEAPEVGQTIEEALEKAATNRIYYGQLSNDNPNKGFYFKSKTHEYISFDDYKQNIDPTFNATEYVKGRKYYNLTQFRPGELYTYVDRNFYLATESVPTYATNYYKLGEPIPVTLTQWQPDIEDNEGNSATDYSYYQEGTKYIKDTSSWATPGKQYFSIVETQATGLNNVIYKPQPHKLLEEIPADLTNFSSNYLRNDVISDHNINGIYEGLFYLVKDDQGHKEGLVAMEEDSAFVPNVTYYYVTYAKGSHQDEKLGKNNALYFIDSELREAISFLYVFDTGLYENLYLDHNIDVIEFLPDTYYSKLNANVEPYQEGYQLLEDMNHYDEDVIYYRLTIKDAPIGGGEINPNVEKLHYYRPGVYFCKINGDYLLSTSQTFDAEGDYFLLTDKNNNLLTPNIESGLVSIAPESSQFYIPGEYYYRLEGLDQDILDSNIDMKTANYQSESFGKIEVEPSTGLIYFKPQNAYVVNDEAGILQPGYLWNKNIDAVPDSVTLGMQVEKYKWEELQGFSKTMNTINGLILELNKWFKFNDNYTRDRNTIKGCLNELNDIIRAIGVLNPYEIVTVDNYGRLVGSKLSEIALTGYETTSGNLTADITSEDSLLLAIKKLEERIKALES